MENIPLKIAVISHSYPVASDPGRAQFIRKEAHLISLDHHVEVHLPSVIALPFQNQYNRNRQPLENTLPVHQSVYISIPDRRFSSITQYSLSRSLIKTIGRQDPDIVHIHSLYPAGLAMKTIKEAGYPVIVTIHGGDWYYNLSNKRLMARLLDSLNYCDKIICVGKRLVQDIERYEPALKEKLVHIPHGIDTRVFQPAHDLESTKEKLGWNREKIHLLAVGNLYKIKGIDLLLQAFAGIRRRPDYHLHIVTPRADSEAKEEVNFLMKKHNLYRQVTFYGNKQPADLAEFFKAADLFISPSRKEGFGLVVAEALACGTPVLATRSGGPEEIITPQTGKLTNTEDPEALRVSLENMISIKDRFNPDFLHSYIDKTFSITSKKRKLNNLYQMMNKNKTQLHSEEEI